MTPLKWGFLLALLVGGGVLGLTVSVFLVSLGHHPLGITLWLGVLFGVIAIVLWYMGRQVRNLKAGEDTKLTPLQASRVAAMARSIAINGSWFSGFLIAVSAVGLTRTWAPAMLNSAIGAGVGAIGALVMTAVAWIVERWCIDDSDSDQDRHQTKHNRNERGAHGAARVEPSRDG